MRLFSLLTALAILVAACGDAGAGSGDDVPRMGVGPGITVSQAIDGDDDEPVIVKGYLFFDADGVVTIADSILESYPPQPGGATLVVEGLDLTAVEGLRSDQGRSWTDDTVQLVGTVEGGKLIVDSQISG